MAEFETGTISHIVIYPVKSCGGIELDNAYLSPSGLSVPGVVTDREYMIVKSAADNNGVHKFVTQRDKRGPNDRVQGLADLAKIKPKITADGRINLSWMGEDPITIPSDLNQQSELTVMIWDHFGLAPDMGDNISEWLSRHLQYSVRLVRASGEYDRSARQNYLANSSKIAFQDSYPILWMSQASLDELSERADQEIPWKSFRPNIVVNELSARYEHQVFEGTIGGISFVDPKPCDRCPITNIDQETGEIMEIKPMSILKEYKKWNKGRGAHPVIFGENMLPQGVGYISKGSKLTTISHKNPPLVYGESV